MFKRKKRDEKEKPWKTFNCCSPQIRKITTLFKYTNIDIALRKTNTLQQNTKPKTQYKENTAKADFINLNSSLDIDHTSDKNV